MSTYRVAWGVQGTPTASSTTENHLPKYVLPPALVCPLIYRSPLVVDPCRSLSILAPYHPRMPRSVRYFCCCSPTTAAVPGPSDDIDGFYCGLQLLLATQNGRGSQCCEKKVGERLSESHLHPLRLPLLTEGNERGRHRGQIQPRGARPGRVCDINAAVSSALAVPNLRL